MSETKMSKICFNNHDFPLSSGRIVCCLLANGVAIYCNRFLIILISNPVGVDHLPRGCRHDAYQTRGPSLDPGQEEELKFSPVLSRSPAISIKLPSLRIFLTNMASMSVCHHQCHQAIVGEQGRGRRSRRHARASEA